MRYHTCEKCYLPPTLNGMGNMYRLGCDCKDVVGTDLNNVVDRWNKLNPMPSPWEGWEVSYNAGGARIILTHPSDPRIYESVSWYVSEAISEVLQMALESISHHCGPVLGPQPENAVAPYQKPSESVLQAFARRVGTHTTAIELVLSDLGLELVVSR